MVLNEKLEFSSVSSEVKTAFLGVPAKILLSTGTRLYKWTDYPLSGRVGITPWWCFVERRTLPNGKVAEGFRNSETAAGRLGVSHRDYQKVRAAVGEKFNNKMENLQIVELTTAAWGFAGVTRGQPEFKDPKLANVYFIGGKGQLWLPNLTSGNVREIPSLG